MNGARCADSPGRVVSFGQVIIDLTIRVGRVPHPGEDVYAPGPWNAPAAYWFWHHIPTRSEIVAQIQAMRDAGYQSFQIQTRLSFPRDRYLSDDYLAMCRLAADEAAFRGMMIGVYDEYNWLSGHAGGLTVQGRDELRERHLFHVTVPVGASGRIAGAITGIRSQDVGYLQEPGRQWVYDGGEPLWDEWTLVGAIGVSGGSVQEDTNVAKAGVASLNK